MTVPRNSVRVALAASALALASALVTPACGGGGEDRVEDVGKSRTTGMTTELAFPGKTGVFAEGLLLVRPEAPPRVGYEEIEGKWVFEGDIILDPGILVPEEELGGSDIGEQSGGLAGTADAFRLWPGGVVPFVVDGLPNAQRVTDAIAQFHAKTKVRWVERTSEADYVVFRREQGCFSYVGRVGGPQVIGLADACSTGNTVHEMLHALGAWHEQSRADRDHHVAIRFENVQAGQEHNFKTYLEQGFKGTDLGGYDFGSIMHYDSYAFSKNGQPTIVRRGDGQPYATQRDNLSGGDVAGIATLYGAGTSTGGCVPQAVAGAENERFKDMPPGSLGHAEAILLADAGITGGCKADPPLYCPSCSLTRAQMVTFLVRAAGLPLVDPATPSFSDVPKDSPSYKYVETAAANGITQGCSAGKFCPAAPVTRGQMAAFIRRARNWQKESPASPSFSDVPPSHTFYGDVEAIKAHCVTEGCAAGKYCVDQSITRAQAAVFIARAFDLGGANPCDGSSCVPKTCEELGAQCGSAADGCGNQLACGQCPILETCQSNKCAAL